MRGAATVLALAAAVAWAQDTPGESGSATGASLTPIGELSFKPLFETFDADGVRVLSDWNYGGVTDVKKNYIRLTPDRAVREN